MITVATIKDIAEKLGVSQSTVSKGLNGASDISEELRAEVLETAVAMGYKKPGMKKKSDRKLIVFVENMAYMNEDDFGYDIILGFKQIAYKEHYAVDVIETSRNFQSACTYDSYMMEHGYSGSFLIGYAFDDPWMEQFKTSVTPTVLLDNFVKKNPKVGYIGTDNAEAIDMAITHLIKLGHEKIAFLDGSKDSLVSDQRMAAYLDSMIKHNLHVDPNMAIYSYFVADAAKYHVGKLLGLGATAIVCGNDLIAQGVLEAVVNEGLRVPDDVSVIGFDDIPLAAELKPSLTTIRQNRTELGKSAYFILKAIINDIPMSRSLLRPQLVVRDSTAEARPRMVRAHANDGDSVLNVNPSLYTNILSKERISV